MKKFLSKGLFSILVLLFLLPYISNAQKSDYLFLANGDKITGEIKKLQYGVLSFKTDDIGTITINWDDVRRIISANRFELTLSDNKILYGSIDTSTNEREIILSTDEEKVSVNMDKLVKVVLIKNTFLSRLDGNLNLGLNYSKGSKILRFDLGGALSFRSLHDYASISGNSQFSLDKRTDSTITTKKQDLNLKYMRYFKKRWYIMGLIALDQNTELGLKLRSSLGVAGGKEIFQNNLHALTTGVGVIGNREKPLEGETTTNIESAVLIDYKIYKHSYPKIILTTSLYTMPSLSDLGRVRISGQTDLDFEFFNDFFFSINSYQSFDNRPASEGASKYDWGITTSIGYSF